MYVAEPSQPGSKWNVVVAAARGPRLGPIILWSLIEFLAASGRRPRGSHGLAATAGSVASGPFITRSVTAGTFATGSEQLHLFPDNPQL